MNPLIYLASYDDLATIAMCTKPNDYAVPGIYDYNVLTMHWLQHWGNLHYTHYGQYEISQGLRKAPDFDPWCYIAGYPETKPIFWDQVNNTLNENAVCFTWIVYGIQSGLMKNKNNYTNKQATLSLCLSPSCVYFNIQNKQVVEKFKNTHDNADDEFRINLVMKYFTKVYDNHEGIVDIGDGPLTPINIGPLNYPLYVFGKSRHLPYEMIPDPYFLNNKGYKTCVDNIKWENKKNMAFWRGASTGFPITEENYMNLPRVKLCKMSNDHLDARIAEWVQCSNELKQKLKKLNIYNKGRVPFSEFYKYKIQVNIDGNCCAWNSFYKKLKSKCVVLHVESGQIQWYYHLLVPYVHYIPVKADLSNLHDQISFVLQNDSMCKQIAENACKLMNDISSMYIA